MLGSVRLVHGSPNSGSLSIDDNSTAIASQTRSAAAGDAAVAAVASEDLSADEAGLKRSRG